MQIPTLSTTEDVMFFDTDIGGVIHNLAYLRMIETNRTQLVVEKMEMDLQSMTQTSIYPVLLHTEAHYKRPGTLGDKIEITGSLLYLEGVRFWMQFEVRKQRDRSLLVTATQSLALVQMPDAKPIRLPKEWRNHWKHLTKPSQV